MNAGRATERSERAPCVVHMSSAAVLAAAAAGWNRQATRGDFRQPIMRMQRHCRVLSSCRQSPVHRDTVS